MDEHNLNTLFRAAIREIHNGWRSRQSLSSFVNLGESALRRIRSQYNCQQATATATIVTEKLSAAANVRQLTFTTNLCPTTLPRFHGYMVQISYQGGVYG